MRADWILILALAVPINMTAQEGVADWAKKTFSAPSEEVFSAALASIATLHYEVQSKDEGSKTIRFRVGRSAFSWGYIMMLRVSQGENEASNVSMEVDRLRGPGPNGKVSLVASGKKEVQKIFQGIEKELAKQAHE
jgi:acyl-homoserine lactone acylase PvdQ